MHPSKGLRAKGVIYIAVRSSCWTQTSLYEGYSQKCGCVQSKKFDRIPSQKTKVLSLLFTGVAQAIRALGVFLKGWWFESISPYQKIIWVKQGVIIVTVMTKRSISIVLQNLYRKRWEGRLNYRTPVWLPNLEMLLRNQFLTIVIEGAESQSKLFFKINLTIKNFFVSLWYLYKNGVTHNKK